MNTKTRMLMLSAALIVSAGFAQAAITANDIVQSYQDAAFTSIEVTEGPTLIKVEAIKDGVKLEILYDKASGEVIRREQGAASAKDAAKTGVEVRSVADDAGVGKHRRGGKDGRKEHDSNDDDSSDSDDSDDDSDDDNSDDDSDDDNDHDSGDDHGSDHDSGGSGSDDDNDDSDDN